MDNYILKLKKVLKKLEDKKIIELKNINGFEDFVKNINELIYLLEDAIFLEIIENKFQEKINSEKDFKTKKEKYISNKITDDLNVDEYIFENQLILSKELKKENLNLYYVLKANY